MISSVIANLDPTSSEFDQVVDEISRHPNLEIGALIQGSRIPITIDCPNNDESERVTRWLQSLSAVTFVDVVFVHLEN